jgi:hypothetical protein
MGAGHTSSDKGDTVMYLGSTNKGVVTADLFIACDYGSASFTANKAGTWINIHWMDGAVAGHARRERPTRWLIYANDPSKKGPTLVGSAQRRTSMRWDVLRGRRLVGHTQGPNGPAAALADRQPEREHARIALAPAIGAHSQSI